MWLNEVYQSRQTPVFLIAFQNAFGGLVRILWTMNTCINPIIYATTIRSFTEFIKGIFKRNPSSNEDELDKTAKSRNLNTQTRF